MKTLRFIAIAAISAAVSIACSKTDGGDTTKDQEPAVEMDVLPTDPQPENLEFNHRMLLVQHTGTACPNCPYMTNALKLLLEDNEQNKKFNLVASHGGYYAKNDPCRSDDADFFTASVGVNSWPTVTFNLTTTQEGAYTDAEYTKQEIVKKMNGFALDPSPAGICATSKIKDGTIDVTIGIKPAADGDYRVAAWLLEDGVYGKQSGAREDWHNTHNNVLRAAAGKVSNVNFSGEKVDGTEIGKTSAKAFSIPFESTWDISNCKVLVFVTMRNDDGKYDIVNTALCPIEGSVAYEYI